MKTYESPLQEAAERFPQTLLWNDSCGVADLNLALRHGATGATSNPVIVGNVMRKEMADWKGRLNALMPVCYKHRTLPPIYCVVVCVAVI